MSEENPTAPAAQPHDKAVVVVLEDGTETRIGPIPYDHIAEQMVRAFERMRHNTAGAGTARFEIVAYDAAAEHLPLVGASMDAILMTWDMEGKRADGPFPDLWARLSAQHGDATVRTAWHNACAYVDATAEEAEQEEAEKKARARRQEIADIVLSFAEDCAHPFEVSGEVRDHAAEELEKVLDKIMTVLSQG